MQARIHGPAGFLVLFTTRFGGFFYGMIAMTITNNTIRLSTNGDGVTTVYPVSFPFYEDTELVVILVAADGTETTQTLTTHYTVDGGGGATGSITMVTAPAAGERLVRYRVSPLTQETDYAEGDAFPADSHEAALDRLTMQNQEQADKLDRSLSLSETSEVTGNVSIEEPIAGHPLKWNATANGIENGSTDLDAIETNVAADAAQVALDKIATAADVVSTNADTTQTALDRIATAADVVSTNADVVAAAASATAADNATSSVVHKYRFDDSISLADPGAGEFRFNNATVASVTAIAFDATTADTGNPDLSDFIATWGASTNTVKGQIVCKKSGTPATFVVFNVTAAVTDNTGWLQVTVTHVASNGTWSASDVAYVQFIRAGDQGGGLVSLAGDTSPQLAAELDGQDNTVKKINLKDYGEVTNAIGSTGGGTQDIDLELGNSVSLTVDTSTNTFTYSNPTATGHLCGFTCFMTNGGSRTIVFPAGQDWVGGVAPTWTTAGVDVWVNTTIDGGTNWLGFVVGLDVK